MDGRRVLCGENELGEIHDIQQGEGGELMPMLFSLGSLNTFVFGEWAGDPRTRCSKSQGVSS